MGSAKLSQSARLKGRGCWQPLFDIGMVRQSKANILEIVGTLRPPRGLARRLDRRKQQRHEDSDDGDHDEQFNKREAGVYGNAA